MNGSLASGRRRKTKRRRSLFFACAFAIVFLVFYCGLELTVRVLGFPDPSLLRSLDRELASAADDPDHAFGWDAPIYGWDQEMIISPNPDDSAAGTSTVLFIGDSVTRGLEVDMSKESFPILMSNRLDVRVLNGAVQGFGVDQMLLKLEELLPTLRPDVVVFAYIPHDLWRAGRNVNYGYTKPILLVEASNDLELIPAEDLRRFYADYSLAKRRFHLGLWSLKHYVANRRYYLPRLHRSYYQQLYRSLAEHLAALADRYDVPIAVVRLTSTGHGAEVDFLDHIARGAFATASDQEHYRYVDTEECVRTESESRDLDHVEEYRGHPGPDGHKILAECLVGTVRAMLPEGSNPGPFPK